jgi:hypothetical protein
MKKRKLENFDPTFEKVTLHCISQMAKIAIADAVIFAVPCKTKGQAINMTQQLRQYWIALSEAFTQGLIPPGDPLIGFAPQAKMLACRTDRPTGKTVEIIHRSQLVTSKLIADALGIANRKLDSLDKPAPGRAAGTSEPTTTQDDLLKDAYGET